MYCYPLGMRTIEEIRLENFQGLVRELEAHRGAPLNDSEVAFNLGISKVYAWQLRSGKRTKIDSVGARKIELHAGKAVGWMDTNFKMWPFPGIEPERFNALTYEQRIEIQGQIRERIERFEAATIASNQKNGTTDK